VSTFTKTSEIQEVQGSVAVFVLYMW